MHSLLKCALLALGVWGHGRLTVPATRRPTGYENDPTSGSDGTDFVCRNEPNSNSKTPVTAGQATDVTWNLSAAHVGDCSVYIGYGAAVTNGVGSAKRAARFIKLANVQDCKNYNGQAYAVDLPDWLPAGEAVIRWEWQALHVWPTIEFYAQCADVIVQSSSTLSAADLPSYPIVGPRLLPANGNEGVGFWNPWNGSQAYMTGPPCAFPETRPARAKCGLTAPGTQGHIDVSDRINNGGTTPPPVSDPTPQPTPAPIANTSTRAPTVGSTEPPAPTPAPVPSPTVGGTEAPRPATPAPTVGGTEPPAPTAEPTQPPVASPATPAPTPEAGQCNNFAWGTCGGISNPTAPTCCPEGYYCAAQNRWYHQCINYPCQPGWDCYDGSTQGWTWGRRLQEENAEDQPEDDEDAEPTFKDAEAYRAWCSAFTTRESCTRWCAGGRFRGVRGNGECVAPKRLKCRMIKDADVCTATGCKSKAGKCCGKAFE